MTWIPALVWAGALAVALFVLGFAGYETRWKVARLRTDLDRLLALGDTVKAVQSELVAVQERLGRTRVP